VPQSPSYEIDVVSGVTFATEQYTTRRLSIPAGLKLGAPVVH
jgi:hypothetical protein